MVVTLQARLRAGHSRRLLMALPLGVAMVVALFLLTPAFQPQPYRLAEEPIVIVRMPDLVPPPAPPLREIPLPRPRVIIPVDEPGADLLDPDDVAWDPEIPPPMPDGIPVPGYRALASSMPRLLHRVEPRYPELARDAELAGTVWLELRIDASGRVTSARPVGIDAHALLVDAAIAAALRWRFAPATQQGHPVASTVRQRVVFDLR